MDGFSIVSQIGAGSYGVVMLAETIGASHDRFVLKQIDLRKLNHKERAQAFVEVTILSEVGGHPNIVTFHRSFEHDHHLVMVMDYCDKGDLFGVVQKQHNDNRKRGLKQSSADYRFFPEAQIWDWFMQICLAVRFLHDRHVLHRDLKSQNVFLTSDNHIKVGDFGIAKVLDGTVNMTRTCIGTPFYLSPEICENKPYDTKSDIWSLGCLLYEMSALQHPFHATNMKNLMMKITRASYPPLPIIFSITLRNLVGQLLKLKAEDRPNIHQILSRPFIRKRLSDWLPKQQRTQELHEIYSNTSDQQVAMQENSINKGHSRKHSRRMSLSPSKHRSSQTDPIDFVMFKKRSSIEHLGPAIQSKNLDELQELAIASLSETAEDENGNKLREKNERPKSSAVCCENEDKPCRKCGRAVSVPKKTCRKCSVLDAHSSAETMGEALTRQTAAQLRMTLNTLLGADVYHTLHQQLISDGNWLLDDRPPALFAKSPQLGQMFRELLIAECIDDLSVM